MTLSKPKDTPREVTRSRSPLKAPQIEAPEQVFYIQIKRGPVFNTYSRPARWERHQVLAQTERGALAVARYHFYRANDTHLRLISASLFAETPEAL